MENILRMNMTDLPAVAFDVTAWKQKQTEARDAAYRMVDVMANSLAVDENALLSYLTLQGRFDKFSVRNALLLTKQMPEASDLRSRREWAKEGVGVKTGAEPLIVLKPQRKQMKDGSYRTYFNAGDIFDISQTNADVISLRRGIGDETFVEAVAVNPPVSLTISDSLTKGVDAFYLSQDKEITVRRGTSIPDLASALARELTYAFLDGEGVKRSDIQTEAELAAYLVCEKFGVTKPQPDLRRAVKKLGSLENAEARINYLSGIRKTAGDISLYISRNVQEVLISDRNRDEIAR